MEGDGGPSLLEQRDPMDTADDLRVNRWTFG